MELITSPRPVAAFGRSVRVFLADSQGFRHFMATDLSHEDTVGAAAFGSQNNLLVTGSQDGLIQVRGTPGPPLPTKVPES